MANIKVIQPGAQPMASDINQVVEAFSGQSDLGSMTLAAKQATPSAPTVGVVEGGVLTGTYKYQLVYVTGWADSYDNLYIRGFAPSAETSISLTAQKGSITIPSFSAPVAAVLVYRTLAGGATGTEKYVGMVMQNTGYTFVDNVADGAIGVPPTTGIYNTSIPATVPGTNTTGTTLTSPLPIVITQATGVAPFTVSSTTVVTNFNADMLDGLHADAFAPSGFGLGGNAIRLTEGYNLDLLTNNGWYDVLNPANGVSGLTWHKILVINSADTGDQYVTQLAFTMTDTGDYMCIRQRTSVSWQSWKRIASVADANTWTNSNVFNVETHFTDATYSDPWASHSCAIKVAGDVGVGGSIRATEQLISTIATGTAPMSVNSTTKVTGFNADLLDGYHAGNASGNIPVSNGTVNGNLNANMVEGQDLAALDSRYVNTNGDTMGGDLYFDTSSEKRVCPANASYRWGMFLNSSRVGWYDWANSRSIMYYQASNGDIVADRMMRFGAGVSGIGRISAYSWNGTVNNGVSANFTHNLGYKPIVCFSGTRGNIIMTVEHTDLNNMTITCYSSGGSNFTGYIYAW